MRSYSIAQILFKYPSLASGSLDVLSSLTNTGEPYYVLTGGGNRMVLLNKSDYINHVLREQSNKFIRSKALGRIISFLSDGIFAKDSDEWNEHRTNMQPIFRPNQIQTIWKDVFLMFQSFFDELSDKKDKIDVEKEMKDFMLEVIFKIYFLKELPFNKSKVSFLVDDLIIKTNVYNHSIKELIDHLKRSVGIKKRSDLPHSFYELQQIVEDIYIYAEKNKDSRGLLFNSMYGKVSKEHLKGEICSLLFAGYDAVSSCLNWSLYELCKNPDWVKKIKNESQGFDLSEMHFLKELKETKKFVSEILRLYPSVTLIPRIAIEDSICGDLEFKKGDFIFISPFLLHRLEEIWDKPYNFNPERFKDFTATDKSKIYMPFGAGKMTCVGNHLAISLISLGVVMMSRQFCFELINKEKPRFLINTVIKSKKSLKIQNKNFSL